MSYPTAGNVRRVFLGFVKKFGEQVGVDSVVKSPFEIRATGRVARTEVVN